MNFLRFVHEKIRVIPDFTVLTSYLGNYLYFLFRRYLSDFYMVSRGYFRLSVIFLRVFLNFFHFCG